MLTSSPAYQSNAIATNQTGNSIAHVALLSDRWLDPQPWLRRGMSLSYLPPVAFEGLLVAPPNIIVLEPAVVDPGRIADCWQLHDLRAVPILVLAEGVESDEVTTLLQRGADDVVTDHPETERLAAGAAAILRRTRGRTRERSPAADQTPAVLYLDDAEVDLSCRIVRRAGRLQTLSRTEFNLLQALVSARGRACGHAELVTRVWGAECASATHYLRLYVRYLRQKIERDPLRPRYILNVRGIGYRFVLDTGACRHGGDSEPEHVSVPA